MATVKLVLNREYTRAKKSESESEYPLVIKLSHRTKKKHIKTGYSLTLKQWSDTSQRVTKNFKNCGRANVKLSEMMTIALDVCSKPKEALRQLSVYEIADIIQERFKHELYPAEQEVLSGTKLRIYGDKIIERHRKSKRHGMADSFEQAIDVFLGFNKTDDILMKKITITLLQDFEADWLGKGNKLGGLGVHLRAIRRIFNLAIQDESTTLTMDHYPFGTHGYSIKKGRTQKRAISLEYIQKIRELDYEEDSPIWHHRNYFLFMFNLRGMNFVDLSFLKVGNIKAGRLIYERSKTKRGDNVKTFNIKLSEEAKDIISYYKRGKSNSDLLFPIMEDVINCGDELKIHKSRKNRLGNHNRRLQRIARDIDLDGKLTTYVARHTFATAGLHKGVSKTQIGEMLGHTSAVTTEAYFDEFDKQVLDDAADAILG